MLIDEPTFSKFCANPLQFGYNGPWL